MSDSWILASKCPHCGGTMTVSVFYSYSRDYRIGRNGQPHKKCKKSCDGEMDVCTASCSDCNTYWDGNNTFWVEEGVFVRGKGMSI